MKNLKHIYIIFIALLLLTVCSDDFVYVDSEDKISEDYFNSEQDDQDALVVAYDYLQTTSRFVQWAEVASDNTLAGGESSTDTPPLQQIDDMIHTPVNDGLKSLWDWMYSGVNRANFILEFQDKVDWYNIEEYQKITKKNIIIYYFNKSWRKYEKSD